MYMSCTDMCYVCVTHSIYIILLTFEFNRALARPKAWECGYHPCPTLSCRALVHWQAQIWIVGSGISCCLVEMILLTGCAVDVTAAIGAFCCLA